MSKLKYKLTFKMQLTIVDDDHQSPVTKPDEIIGDISHIVGSPDHIKQEICKRIDSTSLYLGQWYWGEDEVGKQEVISASITNE